MAAKAADQIISASGGVLAGVPALAVGTIKRGAFVAAGFFAAEIGAVGLRTSFDAIDQMALKGRAQSAALRGGVGTLATLGVAYMIARKRAGESSAASNARRGAATKAALLMELGVGASAIREYVQDGVATVTTKVQTLLTRAPAAGGTFSPSYSNVLPMRATAGGTLYDTGGTVGRFGGLGNDVARMPLLKAGGDAGFSVPNFIDPTRITKTEVGRL